MKACFLMTVLGLLVSSPAASTSEPGRTVHYPRSESTLDTREDYPLAMLRVALEGSGFTLQPSVARMQQARSLLQLQHGEGVDVVWTVTTPEREAKLRPIRIPIDRGLIGWRLLLIRQGAESRFEALDSGADLAGLLGGQGHDWPDLQILVGNRMRVAKSPTYEGLFAMLAQGHIDYFPRSVSEIWSELEQRRDLPIALDAHWVLHYPSALYYFVHPRNESLAMAIEQGLERALRDGRFQRRFEQVFGPTLRRVDFASRRIIELKNPLLSDLTPLQRHELWFDPVELEVSSP